MIDVCTIYIYVYDFLPQTLYNLIYSIFSSKVGILGMLYFHFMKIPLIFFFYFDLKSHPRSFRAASIRHMVVATRNLLYIVWLLLYSCRIIYDNCAWGRCITKSFLHVFRINTTINRQWAIEFARCRRSWRCYIQCYITCTWLLRLYARKSSAQ